MHVLLKICVLLAIIILFFGGVDPLTFRRCRADDPRGLLFIVECPVGQLIAIKYAEIGYSAKYNLSVIPPHCPWRNCTKTIDKQARKCNDRALRTCSISQDLLILSHGQPLCALHRDGNFIKIEYTCTGGVRLSRVHQLEARPVNSENVTNSLLYQRNGADSTSMSTNINVSRSVSTATTTASPCTGCGHMTTTLNFNNSHKEQSSLPTGAIVGVVIGSVILCLLVALLIFFCCRHTRKAHKTTSNGSATKATTKSTNQEPVPATFEMACDVNGGYSTIDTNGRSVSVNQATSTHKDVNGLSTNCSNGETSSGGCSTVTPIQLSQEDFKTQIPIYSQVNKKRATRTAQLGGYETIADDFSEIGGKVEKEVDGVAEEERIVCDSIRDITLVDNPIYAGITMPSSSSSSPAAAADAAARTAVSNPYEEIDISNTDITLIDNAIYNK